MNIPPLNIGQAAAEESGVIHRFLMRWLSRLAFVANVGVVPVNGIIWANISSTDITAYFTSGLGNADGPYEGWAICNGANGTPNLTDRFIRSKVTGSGATGGSDSNSHTHAIDHDHGAFTSAAESGHTHAIDHDHGAFTSGSESAHTHSIDHDHALITSGAPSATVAVQAGAGTTVATDTHTHSVDPPSITATSGAGSAHDHAVDVPAITATSGASSGHTHGIDVPSITATSGAASATENRPAYYELVPLMRVWV